MARIASDVTSLIGRTPLLDLSPLLHDGASPETRGGSPSRTRLLGKMESWNPTGSNKDRAVLAMIRDAERCGFLRPGSTIVECSGGDLALSIAMVGRARGYRVVLTMPSTMAGNRCNLLRALGAEVEFTPTEAGIRGALERAEALAKEIDGGWCPQPFSNRANSLAHRTTAWEIWEDTDGRVDAVVCPVGTGGTASGVAQWYRDREPQVVVFGVEPAASPVINGGEPGNHNIPGLGAGFVPDIFDPSLIEEVLTVTDEAAEAMLRRIARVAHFLPGPASSAVTEAAIRIASRPGFEGKTLVAVLPDSGERYIEHPAYQGLGAIQ